MYVNGTTTITGAKADDNKKRADKRYKEVIFKDCAPLTDCISKYSNKYSNR